MQNSYLIQRMKKPWKGEPKNLLQNIMKHGLSITGLNKEAMDVISKICIFDYMGSAEYEFGAIPKALHEMSKKELVFTSVGVAYEYHAFGGDKKITGMAPVYIICSKEDTEEVIKRIREFGLGNERCKERTQFSGSLAEYEYDKDIVGWFDLDNHFMFFKDVEMFRDWLILFK